MGLLCELGSEPHAKPDCGSELGDVGGDWCELLYNDSGFLSALAVLPEFREQRVAKLLIAATLGDHVQRLQVTSSTLHVLGSDANPKLHKLYASVGYSGGHSKCGGDYTMAAIPADIEARIMTATHTATADTSSRGGKASVRNIVL
jgi:hypothetical protein